MTTIDHRTADLTITVTDAAGQPVPRAAVRIQQRRHAFLFGCNGFLLGQHADETFGRAYHARFADLFNFATLPFYWGSYERAAGLTGQARLEQMARWCAERGIATKGHPLVWTHPAGVPLWLPDDLEEVRALSDSRVRNLVRHFRGLIDRWDVVNEATDPFRFANRLASQLQADGLLPSVRRAYQLARAANPDAELVINDYRLDADFAQVVEQLVDDTGEPLYDVIGLQTHQHAGPIALDRLVQVCDTFAQFGVPLHFTETTLLSGRRAAPGPVDFESREPQFAATSPDDEALQAEAVTDFYTTLFAHPAVEAITWWDFSDRGAWLAAPAGLIRADGSPKPAYEALLRLVKHDWWTDLELVCDDHGQAHARVFAGELAVTARDTTVLANVMRRGSGAVGVRVE